MHLWLINHYCIRPLALFFFLYASLVAADFIDALCMCIMTTVMSMYDTIMGTTKATVSAAIDFVRVGKCRGMLVGGPKWTRQQCMGWELQHAALDMPRQWSTPEGGDMLEVAREVEHLCRREQGGGPARKERDLQGLSRIEQPPPPLDVGPS